MKNNYLFLSFTFLLLLPFTARTQSWGLGLRLGDPSGITLKHYKAGKAWELSVGRTRYWYKDDWYGKRFYRWYDGHDFPYDEISYQGYRSAAPIAVQLHFLIRKPLEKKGNVGLEWYYGFGAQARLNTFYYDYRYKLKGNGNWIYVSEERVPNVDVGADVVIGLEYKFKGPFSLFVDGTLFMEIVDDPFLFRTQAGIGLRYRF